MIQKVIKETNAIGRLAMECIAAINEVCRHAGFAPVQRALSLFPRQPATLGDESEAAEIGAIQAHVDCPHGIRDSV